EALVLIRFSAMKAEETVRAIIASAIINSIRLKPRRLRTAIAAHDLEALVGTGPIIGEPAGTPIDGLFREPLTGRWRVGTRSCILSGSFKSAHNSPRSRDVSWRRNAHRWPAARCAAEIVFRVKNSCRTRETASRRRPPANTV